MKGAQEVKLRMENGEVCMRHGSKSKVSLTMQQEICTNQAKKGGVCVSHGAEVKRCSSEGFE